MPFLPPPAFDDGGFLFPEEASTFAGHTDNLFWLITWISVAFFVPMMGVMGWFMWRYRHKPSERFSPDTPSHNLPLELTWTVIPTLLVVVIFGFGFTGYLDMRTPPADAYEVRVIAKQWNFLFSYADAGFTSDKLYVPVGRPVRLRMVSQDVIHSFYVPAFRAKWDVVPGRDSVVWFTCTEPGEYLYECTEYCGKDHSYMIGDPDQGGGVIALPLEEFEDALRAAKIEELKKLKEDPVAGGQELYAKAGCASCHSVDGSAKSCPTWQGLWGTEREFTDGTGAVADDEYIRESILEPDAKVVKNYRPVMQSYKGQLEPIQIWAITQYMRTLSEEGRAASEAFAVPPPGEEPADPNAPAAQAPPADAAN